MTALEKRIYVTLGTLVKPLGGLIPREVDRLIVEIAGKNLHLIEYLKFWWLSEKTNKISPQTKIFVEGILSPSLNLQEVSERLQKAIDHSEKESSQ